VSFIPIYVDNRRWRSSANIGLFGRNMELTSVIMMKFAPC